MQRSIAPPRCVRRSAIVVNASQQQHQQLAPLPRRGALAAAAAAVAVIAHPLPAAAAATEEAAGTSLGQAVAGSFVGWWKSRRSANGGAKLLAPLRVAQRRLADAGELLQGALDSDPTPDTLVQALQLVRSSSLNCYVFEALPEDSIETRTSLLTQRWELSDPCTFRIVLKNVTDLEDAATQDTARQLMNQLVLSYQKLDALLDMWREGNAEAAPRAREQLRDTQLLAADVEAFVRTTLGV